MFNNISRKFHYRSLRLTQIYLKRDNQNIFDPRIDYYRVLQVSDSASDTQIKQSYYRLAKVYHPDSHPGKQNQFKNISEAYSILSNPQTRQNYNLAKISTKTNPNYQKKYNHSSHNNKSGWYSQNSSHFDSNTSHHFTNEKAKISEQLQKMMKRLIIFGLGIFIILHFFSHSEDKGAAIQSNNTHTNIQSDQL